MSQTDINQIDVLIQQKKDEISELENLKKDFKENLEQEDPKYKIDANDTFRPEGEAVNVQVTDDKDQTEDKEATSADQEHVPDGRGDPNQLGNQDPVTPGDEAETLTDSGADTALPSGSVTKDDEGDDSDSSDDKPAPKTKAKKASKKKS